MWLRSLAPEPSVQIALCLSLISSPSQRSGYASSLGLPPRESFLTPSCFASCWISVASGLSAAARSRARRLRVALARERKARATAPSPRCPWRSPGVEPAGVGEVTLGSAASAWRSRRRWTRAPSARHARASRAALRSRSDRAPGCLAQVAIAGQRDEREHGERGDDTNRTPRIRAPSDQRTDAPPSASRSTPAQVSPAIITAGISQSQSTPACTASVTKPASAGATSGWRRARTAAASGMATTVGRAARPRVRARRGSRGTGCVRRGPCGDVAMLEPPALERPRARAEHGCA